MHKRFANSGYGMIGLVLVTHGRLADEFLSAVEHVVGKQQAIATIAMGPTDNVENRREDLLAAIASVELGQGVIILTDMFGGTPSNLSISMMKPGKIEVIAGMNLPMLVKLATSRQVLPLADAACEAQEAGKKYINIASNLLGCGSC